MEVDSKLFTYIIEYVKDKRGLYPKKSNHYVLAFSSNFIPVKGCLGSIHAEHGVIIILQRNIHTLKKNEPIDIVSIRMSSSGTIGNARPCEGCIIRMSKCPIKINNIFYPDDANKFKKEKFRDMLISKKNRFSSGDNRKTKCNM